MPILLSIYLPRDEFIGIGKDWGDFMIETEWYNQEYSNNIEIGAPGIFQVIYILYKRLIKKSRL